MATSLAFGVVFATVLSLFMVPAGYLILEDIKAFFGRLFLDDDSDSGSDDRGRPVAADIEHRPLVPSKVVPPPREGEAAAHGVLGEVPS